MKRKYVTPLITFEPLTASTSIAAPCAMKQTHPHDEFECPVYNKDLQGTIFADWDLCNFVAEDGSVCYTGPTDMTAVFGS